MTPSPTSYVPIAKMYAVTVYADRPTYAAGHGGTQAPPFNPAAPVQMFDSPGTSPVPCFDPSNPPGYVTMETIAGPANIPGAYTYPQRPVAPTTAYWTLYGTIQMPVEVSMICSEAEAQQVAAALALVPQFAGLSITLNENAFDPTMGPEASTSSVNWGTETRRYWGVTVAGIPSMPINCAELSAGMAKEGEGYPGGFTYAPLAGNPDKNPQIQWVPGTPVTQPPVGQKALPIPIYPVPTGYQISAVGQSLFNQTGTFVLMPIPSATPTVAQQIALLEAQEASIIQQIQALQAQQG